MSAASSRIPERLGAVGANGQPSLSGMTADNFTTPVSSAVGKSLPFTCHLKFVANDISKFFVTLIFHANSLSVDDSNEISRLIFTEKEEREHQITQTGKACAKRNSPSGAV